MHNDDGVLLYQLLAAHNGVVAILELLLDAVVVAVDGRQPFESLAEPRAQRLVGRHARAHERVAARRRRRLEHADERHSRRLRLGRLVRVPLYRAPALP